MNLNSLFVKSIRTRSELINYQTLRWRRPRKPFWLGLAKSKMFIVPQPRKIYTDEEKKINQKLLHHYSTCLKSILKFIRTDNPRLKITYQGEDKENSYLREKIAESLKNNEKWNAESARLRDERTKKILEKEMETSVEKISIEEEKRRQQMEIIENIVRSEKKNSQTFITPENLDEAIEVCLNTIECYDFAIDLEGNQYPGRETLRPSSVQEIKVKTEQNV